MTVQETQVRFLGWEDPLKEEMAIHSSMLAWEIPWTEEPGWLQSMGCKKVRYNWATNNKTSFLDIAKKKKAHKNKKLWDAKDTL